MGETATIGKRLELRAKTRARALHGHPWVFARELASPPSPESNGQGVALQDSRGRFIGSGIVNTGSQIVWRRYSRDERPFDGTFLEEALQRSIDRRPAGAFRRLVWSEADDLPGLVVDQYDDVLVLQALTLAMDLHLETIIEILRGKLQPREIVLRNDAPSRSLEGLERVQGTFGEDVLEPFEAEIDGIRYRLDLLGSQKTGFYLDQRAEHLRIRGLAKGRRVLDSFCNQGSFALQAKLGGASEVLGLDSSTEAIAQARENAARNGLEATFEEANVFDWFTAHRRERFGLIVLDPPSFARNKAAVPGALRGYKELNLRALRLLEPGGILATYSCSQHVGRDLFAETLEAAAGDVRRAIVVRDLTRQPGDHPVLLGFPESEYLCGAILEARD